MFVNMYTHVPMSLKYNYIIIIIALSAALFQTYEFILMLNWPVIFENEILGYIV